MNIFVQDYIDSCRCEKTFFSPFALAFELRFRAFHLSVKLYSLSFGKTYNLNYLSSSVRFLLKSFFYSVVKDLCRHCRLVGLDGLEPSTSRLSGARSSHLSYKPRFQLIGSDSSICLSALPTGGDEGNRTLDPLLAGQVLSQLSYTPIKGLLLLFQ